MLDKTMENRLRRLARREGYIIRKSRARNWSYDNQLGFMLVDAQINGAVLGWRYHADLHDIAEFLGHAGGRDAS